MVLQFICHQRAVNNRSFHNTYQEVFNASMKRTHPDTEKMKPVSTNTKCLYNFISYSLTKYKQTNLYFPLLSVSTVMSAMGFSPPDEMTICTPLRGGATCPSMKTPFLPSNSAHAAGQSSDQVENSSKFKFKYSSFASAAGGIRHASGLFQLQSYKEIFTFAAEIKHLRAKSHPLGRLTEGRHVWLLSRITELLSME